MNNSYTKQERKHLERIKRLPCSCCGASGPSQAHHIEQRYTWTCIPLCLECHVGRGGIHGTKAMWHIYKLDELGALNATIKMIMLEEAT